MFDKNSDRQPCARSPCASCGPAVNSASRPSPSTPSLTWKASTSSWLTRPICIGPAASSNSYLKIDRIISAAEVARRGTPSTPGLRFSGRKRALRARCASRANIRFIAPLGSGDPHHGRQERRAREAARKGRGADHARQRRGRRHGSPKRSRVAKKIGYPVMIKASAWRRRDAGCAPRTTT